MIKLLYIVAGATIGLLATVTVAAATHRNTIKTLDVVLAIVFLTFVTFSASMIITYWKFGAIPETFACCVVGALVGEIGCTTRITNVKIREKEREWEVEDRVTGDEEGEMRND